MATHNGTHGHARHGTHDHGSPLVTSAHATLHCLIGCVIGEVLGLMIGVSLGLGIGWTIALAVVLAYFFGLLLGVLPIMQREGFGPMKALRVIWLGEVISIGVMEIAMNVTDYMLGGIQTGSIFNAIFWIGIAVAIPIGFIAAWPVNHWLLAKQLKGGH